MTNTYLNPITISLVTKVLLFIHIFLSILLILSGNTEPNPGPAIHDFTTINGSVSIMNLNICSICNKIDFIQDNLSDFDILYFSETHLNNTILDSDLIINNHDNSIYRSDLTTYSGGLLVYVSNCFLSERRCDLEQLCVHAIWVEIKFHRSSFLLCAIYRSPSTPVNFWENFDIALEKAQESNKNIIIVGDLNQDLLLDSNNHLTLSQTTNFRLFQTERVCRRQFQI